MMRRGVALAIVLVAVGAAAPARAATVSAQTYWVFAGGAGIEHADVHYDAAAGEQNVIDLQVSRDAVSGTANPVTIEDSGATITATGAGISAPFPTGVFPTWGCDAASHSAVCASSPNPVGIALCTAAPIVCGDTGAVGGFTRFFVNLGDGNDHLVISGAPTSVRGRVSLGAGNDVAQLRDGIPETIDCGPGYDWVRVDANDVVTGCETVITE
jgi:hypothetical protein